MKMKGECLDCVRILGLAFSLIGVGILVALFFPFLLLTEYVRSRKEIERLAPPASKGK